MSSADWGDFKIDRDDFSRGGPLSPELLVTLLLYMVADAGRRGYEILLDAFWDECDSFGLSLPTEEPISAAAFCKARKKLKAELLRRLLHQVAADCDQAFGSGARWKGSRVFACDGSKFSVQRSDELRRSFGGPEGGHCPQILVSTLYEVFTGVPHDVSVAPFASCERKQLLEMLDRIAPGDVLVLDRGYPSYEIIAELVARGIHFLARVPVNQTFKAVEGFIMTGGRDRVIEIAPPQAAANSRPAIAVRAVYDSRGEDDPMVLVTDLPKSHSTADEIKELYRRRWAVEELYKVEKGNYLGQNQFHARSAEGVRQEVLAFALFVAISRLLMASASTTTNTRFEDLSQKAALLAVAAYITRLCVAPDRSTVTHAITSLLRRISRNLDPPRPGRSFERRSYKPQPKWGAKGRRWTPALGG